MIYKSEAVLKNCQKKRANLLSFIIKESHDRYRHKVILDFKEIYVAGHDGKITNYDSSIKYTDEILKSIYQ